MTIVEPGEGEDHLDLAIADISDHWERLSAEWGNRAIEMDQENWREPRWARAQLLTAAGWPEMGKRNVTVDGNDLVGPATCVSEPSLDDPCTALCVIDRRLSRALQMESYPKFHNEIGVPIVRIGCREFKCIGDKPPQDHPHIYLNMGDASEIICPYCSTLFRFDPSLGAHEADPADCAYGDMD
jgi:uncharacterized Zn-finger protein